MLQIVKCVSGHRAAAACDAGRRPGSWRLIKRAALRLGMDNRGATLIEFGFVAPMLILLLCTIIDLGLMLTTQVLLDGGARDAARLIKTGQIQGTNGTGITGFQNQLCSDLSPILSTATCTGSVIFNVQTYSTYGGVAFTPCTQNSNASGGGTVCNFNAGTGTSIVGVQVTYNRPFIVPWVGGCLTGGRCWIGSGTGLAGGAGTNTAALISTVVFQNEPFPGT